MLGHDIAYFVVRALVGGPHPRVRDGGGPPLPAQLSPPARPRGLSTLGVALVAVLLHDRPRGHLFLAALVPALLLRRVHDVLVLALLLGTDPAKMLLLRHDVHPPRRDSGNIIFQRQT